MKELKEFFMLVPGLFRGLWVTLTYFVRPAVTLQYPDEEPEVPERFRGMLQNDVAKCISCESCVRVCPPGCISLKAEKGEGNRKRLLSYVVNFHSCMYCGLCTEVCPVKCLSMKGYKTTFYERTALFREYAEAPAQPAQGEEKHG